MATTINATRSYEDYEKEQIDKATSRVNAQAAAYKQNQDQTLSQIGAAIDRSAKTAAGVYQQRIDGADAAYKSQYGENAIDEAFAREQVKNSMAASGMTDSGQNLTMQTALSLQRNNRDAAVTENKRNYVQEMQNAIDAVWADAAAQKSAQEVTAQQNYQTFYDNLYANAMSGAQENAVNLYNADLAAQQAAYEAEQQRIAEQAKAKAEAEAAAASRMADYAEFLMKNMDYDEDAAWAGAGVRYPTGDQTVDAYNNAYNAAIKSGYTAEYAKAMARAAVNGQDPETAMLKLAAQETKAAGLSNVGDWNDMFGGISKIADWFDNIVGDNRNVVTQTQYWKQADWEKGIGKLTDAVKKNISSSGKEVSATAQDYTVGTSVANAIKDAATKDNAQMLYVVLADELSDTAFAAAAQIIQNKTGVKATVS